MVSLRAYSRAGLAAFFVACGGCFTPEVSAPADGGNLPPPAQRLSSYKFSPGSSIMARTGTVPGVFLEHMKRLDKRADYRPYELKAAEREILRAAVSRLPSSYKTILKRHVIGIHFIQDFLSNGYQEWVIAEDGRLYSIMVLHPRLLRWSATQMLTMRENTNFKKDSGTRLRYIVPKRWTALDYLLRHEAVHALDYARRISPFVYPPVRAAQEKLGPHQNFGSKYWKDWNVMRPEFDNWARGRITFYGMRKGPHIDIRAAVYLYTLLEKSPFPSLYAMLYRHEDLAELASLGSMCARDCRIEVRSASGSVRVFPLFGNPVTRARADKVGEIINRLTR